MMGPTTDFELSAGSLLSEVKKLKSKDDTGKPRADLPKVSTKTTERTDKPGLKPQSHSSRVVQQFDQGNLRVQRSWRRQPHRSRSPIALGSQSYDIPRRGSFNQGDRGNSHSRGKNTTLVCTGSSKVIAKSSGNVSRHKEDEAKVVVAPKAITLDEEKTPTLIWNCEDLPLVFRENPNRPSRPVQVVVMGGRHLFAIKAPLDALGDHQVFYIYLQLIYRWLSPLSSP